LLVLIGEMSRGYGAVHDSASDVPVQRSVGAAIERLVWLGYDHDFGGDPRGDEDFGPEKVRGGGALLRLANGRLSQFMVFSWRNYRSWRGEALRLLADLIDQSVFAELRRNPPRHFVEDNLGWLDRAIEMAKGIMQPDVHNVLSERLARHYAFIQAFHGCRTDSTRPYSERGLMPSDPHALNRIALEIFSDKACVEAAIQELGREDFDFSYSNYNRGKVFFCLQMEELVEYCGHYLLYGSEYLLAIANRVGQPEVLRSRGRATVVECKVPISNVDAEDIRCLAGDVLREIFERYCVRAYRPEVLEFGFAISEPLQPENIVAFHHPTGIRNPHNFNARED
jgi:hypothetical protein